MAKVNEVKASMGYTTSPSSCATCKHFAFDKELLAWMRGDEFYEQRKEEYAVDTRLRCTLGGFSTKKMASCNEYTKKD